MRLLLGAAEAGFFPGVTFYLRQWFPPSVRAGVMATFLAAGPVSGVIGAPLSGSLLNLHRMAGLSGWQWMFLLEGIPALLLAVAAFFYLPEKPESASWLTRDEKSWLRQSTGEPEWGAAIAPSQNTVSWVWIAAPMLWALAFIDFALNTCTYGVSLWLPSALLPFAGASNVLLGFLAAVPNLVAVILMILVAAHSDRVGERRWHVAGAAIAGAVGLALAGSAVSAVPILAGFSLALAASSSMAGTFWALANDHLSSASAARSIALINAVGNLGGGIGPYWIGHLRDTTGSFRAGLFAVAALMLVASATTVLTGKGHSTLAQKATV
jgi:MFS transporter, ACS family, tartrate transporter